MPSMINPLRYPGAKRSLVKYIGNLIIENELSGCTFYEPYAGSAIVGIELIQKGIIGKLLLCEKDILLYAFWKSVFTKSDELCERINETPITIDEWQKQAKLRLVENPDDEKLLDLGFAGLFLNRTNFSGILKACPIGGRNQTSKYKIDCRFDKEKMIRLIQKISLVKDDVEVHYGDAIDFMRTQDLRIERERCFIYFDPPYYLKGPSIYRHYYSDWDHVQLSNFINEIKKADWLVSYDDAPFICGLYGDSGATYRPYYLDYSCYTKNKSRARGEELLISNLPLPPFAMPNVKACGED